LELSGRPAGREIIAHRHGSFEDGFYPREGVRVAEAGKEGFDTTGVLDRCLSATKSRTIEQ